MYLRFSRPSYRFWNQSFKIEGRGAADYVATVIKTYREAIDSYYEGTFTKRKIKLGWKLWQPFTIVVFGAVIIWDKN